MAHRRASDDSIDRRARHHHAWGAQAKPGLNAILPMPLEDPAIAPPPRGFEDKHLRDRFMLAGYGLQKIAETVRKQP